MGNDARTAPVRARVVAPALAAILLLAALVCVLHGLNALLPCGTARVGDYAQLERTAERFGAQEGKTQALPVYADGTRRFALQIETPTLAHGVLSISGMLLRPEQHVGEVRVRVGLLPVGTAADGSAAWSEEIVLLRTQMVRRSEAARWRADDHCGFAATAARLLLREGQYAVVLLDESDGARRLIDTRVRIAMTENSFTVGHRGEEGGV